MAKDAYYFSHDSNARNDEKILELRMDHDWHGYGLYWAIVEMLREASDYKLELNYKRIAFALRAKPDEIKSIINDYELFIIDEGNFFSDSLIHRMKIKESKSKKMSEISKKRWSKEGKLKDEIRHDSPQAYIIKCYNKDEEFFKIGHTDTTISRRYSGKMPYEYEVFRQFFSKDALLIEEYIQKNISKFIYTPNISFSGHKECYSIESYEILKNIEVIDYEIIKEKTNNIDLIRNASQCVAVDSQCNKRKGKERKGNIYYKSETEFLEDWKKAREKLEGLETNINKLTFEESKNFKNLVEEFSIKQFQDAIVGLFKQKDIFPVVKLRPNHFLRDRNIEKYLDCKVNNKQLFKSKTGSL